MSALYALGDSHGIWISDGSATYLFTPATGLQKMASVGGAFAGGCH